MGQQSQANCEDLRRAGNDVAGFVDFWIRQFNLLFYLKFPYLLMSEKGGDGSSYSNSGESTPMSPDPNGDDDDRIRAEHAKKHHKEWNNYSVDELTQTMRDIRTNGTPYRAGNGNVLFRKGNKILIENKFAPDKGTMFVKNESSKKIARYIANFLRQNR